jgi:recombination protein RecR
MASQELEKFIKLLGRMPGLGPRSARRAALYLLQDKEKLMLPLLASFQEVAEKIVACPLCGNQDTQTPCSLCQDDKRDQSTLCIIETVGDLWALERTGSYKGLYHVLGGVLSPLDGIRPENLRLDILEQRLQQSTGQIQEIIIALSATMNGQTTSHYIAHLLESYQIKVTKLSHGVPVGGELDYLDDGTLSLALQSRRMMG